MGRGEGQRRRRRSALADPGKLSAIAAAALIGIDWGTTSARAYRLDANGSVVGEREAPLGIQQIRGRAFGAALDALLGEWAGDPVPRLACGMIGSRQGWVEAPYVECPAMLDTLATRLARTAGGGGLAIVPGLSDRDAQRVPDVMRGEETQIVGALAVEAPTTLIVLPGTHSKWALAGEGRIDAFVTYMTGELFAVLKAHSILGRMMPEKVPPAPGAAFLRGVRAAARPDLLHAIFGARTLALFDELDGDDVADYLSGVLIGSELAAGRAWAASRSYVSDAVMLVGAPALCERYAMALHDAGVGTVAAPPNAAARGLWRIAHAAGMVG